MKNQFEYTIDGTTYYAVGGKLYVELDETHSADEVDDHSYHLYDGDVVRMEGPRGLSDRVMYYSVADAWRDYLPVDEFDGATPLRSLVPDGINECPECGSWAGSADEDQKCIACGYGIGDDR